MSDKMCVLAPAMEAARKLSWEARGWGVGHQCLGNLSWKMSG